MKPGKNPSVWDLWLCNILGIHNRRRHSGIGRVHYCSRCGIVTKDNRRYCLKVANIERYEKGTKIIFGSGRQEFMGFLEKIGYFESKIALTYVMALPKWHSELSKIYAVCKRFVRTARILFGREGRVR